MRLKIGTPCSEDWNEMTPQDKGRFCQQCEKTVFDLTKSTDQEILDFFRNKDEEVCGRLTRFQLNHDFYEKSNAAGLNSFNRYVAASFALLSMTPAVVAQNNDLNITTPVELSNTIQIMDQEIQGGIERVHDVRLKLTDQDGQPLKYATLRIDGYSDQYKTDSTGFVQFDFPSGMKKQKVRVYVSANHFRYGEIQLDASKHPIQQEIRVEMHEEILMGDIAPIDDKPIEPIKKTNKQK